MIENGDYATLVKSDKLGIAGRFDELSYALGRQKLVLTDFKSGKNYSFTHEVQMGFYSLLLREDPRWQKEVDRVCIFYLEIEKDGDSGMHWYWQGKIRKLETLAMCYLKAYRHYEQFEKEIGRW